LLIVKGEKGKEFRERLKAFILTLLLKEGLPSNNFLENNLLRHLVIER
jgi:hypothetical protein